MVAVVVAVAVALAVVVVELACFPVHSQTPSSRLLSSPHLAAIHAKGAAAAGGQLDAAPGHGVDFA